MWGKRPDTRAEHRDNRSSGVKGGNGAPAGPTAMKITGSQISLLSDYTQLKEHSVIETARAPRGIRRPPAPVAPPGRGMDTVQFSAQAQRLGALARANPTEPHELAGQDAKLRLIVLILERLLGQRIEIVSLKGLAAKLNQSPAERQGALATAAAAAAHGQAQIDGGVAYERTETLYAYERLAFVAAGQVETAGGDRIEFRVEIEMAREHLIQHSLRLSAGRPVDPLVVNFARPAASLVPDSVQVDLDRDGVPDAVPWLAAGSGFLVIDRDGDGGVTDGGEMFGPRSGDGFAELAEYDEDGNGWLDAGDSVFGRLRLWHRDGTGGERLDGLAELGVGAIWLGRVSTPFELRAGDDKTAGLLRSTGVFLSEDGRAGTVQQFDVVL